MKHQKYSTSFFLNGTKPILENNRNQVMVKSRNRIQFDIFRRKIKGDTTQYNLQRGKSESYMLPGKQELIISTYSMAYIEETCSPQPHQQGKKNAAQNKNHDESRIVLQIHCSITNFSIQHTSGLLLAQNPLITSTLDKCSTGMVYLPIKDLCLAN